jgi:hypothetical protein
VTFLDDHSRLGKCYTVKTKDIVLQSFIAYSSWAQSQINVRYSRFEEGIRKTIRILRDDKRGEYSSNLFDEFCTNMGSIDNI